MNQAQLHDTAYARSLPVVERVELYREAFRFTCWRRKQHIATLDTASGVWWVLGESFNSVTDLLEAFEASPASIKELL